MGLLDKLRSALKKPLTDPTERQYYEIAFNLLRIIGSARYQAIKNYVDFKIGGPCDQERLKSALVYIKQNIQPDGEICYFNYSDSDLAIGKNPEVCEISKEIIKRVPYAELSPQKEHAYCVCYADEIQRSKAALVGALDMSAETTGDALCQLIAKIRTDVHASIVALRIALKQSFLENSNVKNAVLQHYFNVLEGRTTEKKAPVYFGAMALKAANFERFGEKEKEYHKLSESDCEEYIRNHAAFESIPLNKQPWFVDEIQRASAFYDHKTHDLFDLGLFWDACSNDDYFVDAVCYFGWLKIKEHYNDEVTTIIEMADTIYDFAMRRAGK